MVLHNSDVNDLFSDNLTYSELIEQFEQKTILDKLQKVSCWVSKGEYIKNNVCKYAYDFLLYNEVLFNLYMEEKITLNALTDNFVKFIHSNNLYLHIKQESVINDLSYGNSLVENCLFNYLINDMPRKSHLNILGFGGGDGSNEKSIGNFLEKKCGATSHDIYIYDPHVSNHQKQRPEIFYITKIDDNLPYFDIILAQWVLHHVKPEYRWQPFLTLANRLADGGQILLLEEGDIQSSLTANSKLIYHMFLMFIDVIINFSLRPEWLTDFKRKAGDQFFLSYLTSADIDYIRTTLHFESKQHWLPITDDFFFPATLIAIKKIT